MSFKRLNKPILYVSFTLYFLMLFWIIVLKLASFDRIIGCASFFLQNKDVGDRFILGLKEIASPGWYFTNPGTYLNILILIPLGYYLTLCFKSYNILRDLLIGFVLIIVFEVLQLFSGLGTFSIVDVITNILGVFIGSIFSKLFKILNHQRILNIINFVSLFALVPIFIYSYYLVFANIQYYQDFPWFGIFKVGPSLNHFDFPID